MSNLSESGKRISAVYLDYASTTPVDPEVLQEMLPYFSEKFGNPSSLHSFGQEAQAAVDVARSAAADFLGCLTQEIIFTGSATEANNIVILNAVKIARSKGIKNPHIIASAIEHKSVLEPIRKLEKDGEITVTYLPVSKEGIIDVEALKNALGDNTALVSIMYANNEIGIIQPIIEVSNIIRNFRENSKFGAALPLMHTDAAQAALYADMKVKEIGVDALTLSGHKIYGPKGVGVLYAKKEISLAPIMHGGEQEYGKRPGTENVPAIVGIGKALSKISEWGKQSADMQSLRDYFIGRVLEEIKFTALNGGNPRTQRAEQSPYDGKDNRLPNNANILFKGISSADLLIMLDMEGIAVSAGSACSAKSASPEPSHVLRAIGLSEKDAKSSIRFSFGRQTTKGDIDRALEVLVKLVKRLS